MPVKRSIAVMQKLEAVSDKCNIIRCKYVINTDLDFV